jgi:hypothetical protein
MPSAGILASGKRFRISLQIINARRAGMFFNSSGFMKQSDKPRFPFLLALAGGRVFTWSNNQSAGKL